MNIGGIIEGALPMFRDQAESMMTDTWVVYRVTGETLNESTGQYVQTTETVYSGPGKLQTFESYEQTATAADATFTTMRPHLHLPVNSASADVAVGHYAVCTASVMDADMVGTTVRIAGLPRKTYQTARRFPVAEDV